MVPRDELPFDPANRQKNMPAARSTEMSAPALTAEVTVDEPTLFTCDITAEQMVQRVIYGKHLYGTHFVW